ncbi:hypothetical protein [Nostoc sp.]
MNNNPSKMRRRGREAGASGERLPGMAEIIHRRTITSFGVRAIAW